MENLLNQALRLLESSAIRHTGSESTKINPSMRNFLLFSTVLGCALASGVHAQTVVVDVPDVTTVGSTTQHDPNNFSYDNNGIWVTMTSSSVSVIDDLSFPGYADGQFQLNTNIYWADPTANIFTQGFFGNGNDVAVGGAQSFNPAKFDFGTTVDGTAGYLAGGNNIALAGGPSDGWGNWNDFSRGAIGVVFPISGELHYGFIDVTVNSDKTITLHGYAYESTAGVGITTFAIPEPSVASLFFGLLALGGIGLRRRR